MNPRGRHYLVKNICPGVVTFSAFFCAIDNEISGRGWKAIVFFGGLLFVDR